MEEDLLGTFSRTRKPYLNGSGSSAWGANHFLTEFLGANVLDKKQFIVMPYLTKGNVRDYFLEHPNGDRLHIISFSQVHVFCLILPAQLHNISLGLVHLHSRKIVHGDLKAVRRLDVLSYICTSQYLMCFSLICWLTTVEGVSFAILVFPV